MKGKWKLGETVFLEPCWIDLSFLKNHEDSKYKDLREDHEAILLKRGCSLIAVLVRTNRDSKRKEKESSSRWHRTFEDAVDAVVARKLEVITDEREKAVVALSISLHYRNNAD